MSDPSSTPSDRPQPDSEPRDARGEWRPDYPIRYAPLFSWPTRIWAIIKWVFAYPGYLWPTNLFLFAVSVAAWVFTQPPIAACQDWSLDWIAQIYLRNLALIWFYYGGYHLYLYIIKGEGTRKKYNRQWPAKNSRRFLFNDQVWDNIFWTAGVGTLIWTAYEVVTMWLFANGHITYLDWASHPVYFILWFFMIPLWREFHFYCVHRLTHWKPLYQHVHYLHHKNVNPNTWSGLAMHPVETTLYFSLVLIHYVIPSHPLHFLFTLQYNGLAPAHGHHGFEGPIIKDSVPTGSYFHYLHHRHFECNYGGSILPLDKIFGTFRDGLPDGEGAKLA